MTGSLSDDGIKLIEEARRIYPREVCSAVEAADNNLAVRRSQEVVELALKGTLRCLGVDYPRVHDVGPVFSNQILLKVPAADKAVLQRIEEIFL
jgi:HEPN domain-containing protein